MNQTNNPFFSIIVPVYNTQLYLEECLNSLINQTFQDFELILVNDGSPDDSLTICENFSKNYPYIRIINQKNKGLSGARNSGFNIAKGKFIWYVDSDDFINKQSLETLYGYLVKEEVDVLGFSFYSFPNNNVNQLKQNSYCPEISSMTNKEYIKNEYTFMIAPWLYVYRKEFLLKNQIIFREDIKVNEDWIYLLSVFSKLESIKCINKFLYYYRIRPDGLARDPKKYLERIHWAEQLIFFIDSERKNNELEVFWDNQLNDILMKYYKLLGNNWKKNENFKKIRKIKLKILSTDSKGKKILKFLHNNCFVLYKFLINL